MRFVLLLTLFVIKVTGFIIMKKAEFYFNPIFGKATIDLVTLPNGFTALNLEINLTKTINGKTMSKTNILYMKGNTKASVLRIPTYNYCDFMRGQMIPMQLVQAFLDRVKTFGRMIVPCPVLPGHYFLKNLFIDETKMPLYRLLSEQYWFVLQLLLHQDVAGKQVKVYDLQVTFTCNKSNWP